MEVKPSRGFREDLDEDGSLAFLGLYILSIFKPDHLFDLVLLVPLFLFFGGGLS